MIEVSKADDEAFNLWIGIVVADQLDGVAKLDLADRAELVVDINFGVARDQAVDSLLDGAFGRALRDTDAEFAGVGVAGNDLTGKYGVASRRAWLVAAGGAEEGD